LGGADSKYTDEDFGVALLPMAGGGEGRAPPALIDGERDGVGSGAPSIALITGVAPISCR
jgi:hypothetical protein